MSLEDDFEKCVRRSIAISKDKGGHPTRIAQMVDRYGAVGAAKRLVEKGDIQQGLRDAIAAGLRDTVIESLMLELRFEPLFTKQELDAARWRLEQV
jgi:hypothetical protein